MKLIIPITALAISFAASTARAEFVLKSGDIQHGELMSVKQEFVGFGCSGGNLSPQLTWSGVPEGTKSFALFAYDPDAPTGSGWWHWQLVNIKGSETTIKQGVGVENSQTLPAGSRQINNDYGHAAFGGACPPKGHGVHRYQFTLHALSTEVLELPESPSSALVGYMVNVNSIATATIEALYKRD